MLREKNGRWDKRAINLEAFATLVPARVSEAVGAFNSRVTGLIEKLGKENQEQHDYAKQHLASLGLPAAVEALDNDKGLPEDVWAKIHDVDYKGGYNALPELQTRVQTADKQAEDALKKIQNVIQQETKEDLEMRQKYGHKWNRRPSEQITAQFKAEIDEIQKYLRTAQESNRKIEGELKENKGRIEMLNQSREQIESKLPKSETSGEKSEAATQLIQQLDELSHLLEKNKK